MKKDSASCVAYNSFSCVIAINGKRYVYSSNEYSGQQLKDKFNSIAKYSEFKAVNWIKNNAEVVDTYNTYDEEDEK